MALAEQEELIKKRFTEQRTKLGAQRKGLENQYKEQTARQSAISGGAGGATAKIQRKGIESLGRAVGESEAGLGAAEAQSLQQAGAEEEARQFATKERLGSQEFSAGESAKQLAQQKEQFGQTLKFQEDSFAGTMNFQWAEMDENVKTNFINTAIALKDAGLKTPKQWAQMWGSMSGLGLTESVGSPTLDPGKDKYGRPYKMPQGGFSGRTPVSTRTRY